MSAFPYNIMSTFFALYLICHLGALQHPIYLLLSFFARIVLHFLYLACPINFAGRQDRGI